MERKALTRASGSTRASGTQGVSQTSLFHYLTVTNGNDDDGGGGNDKNRGKKRRKLAKQITGDDMELITRVNRDIFGNQSFYEMQETVIRNTLHNKDVLVLFPTGGGKSLCYQLPAVMSFGVTFVVSPLLSLTQDQVVALLKKGIPASFINTHQSKECVREIYNDLYEPKPSLKILFLCPETLLKSQEMKLCLQKMYASKTISRFAIDECHCISQWGHAFRPGYKKFGVYLRTRFPDVPVLALTATATEEVQRDIIQSLGMRNPIIARRSFNRPNLHYSVAEKPKGKTPHLSLIEYIKQKRDKQCGIVYCLSRAETEELSTRLRLQGINCDFYHAGMSRKHRTIVQEGWSVGHIDVICATIAYGMGIDKPNVRFVIHFCIPKDMEGYFQESGRAGRDGKQSDCILYYRKSDVSRVKRVIQMPKAYNTRELIQRQLEHLEIVKRYCENNETCRRRLLLSHFSQAFDPRTCNQTCDNCSARQT